jgi:hypothetical protein
MVTGGPPYHRNVAKPVMIPLAPGLVLRKLLALCALVFTAAPAWAQVQPFVFTLTTLPHDGGSRVGVRYDAGYAERTAPAFGYEGLEQRLGAQAVLGRGFTLVAQAGIGLGGDGETGSILEAELLKDVLGASSPVRLALGGGIRREWTGDPTLLARASLGHAGRHSMLFGNLRLEKPFEEGRDALDLLTSLGWHYRLGSAVQLGVEALGEDLEGFWEPEEAEGGARLFVGPSLHWSPPGRKLYASLAGGPIVYATRSARTSDAPRPLGASGNGYTVRFSLGWVF